MAAHLEVDGVRQLELPPPHEPVQHYVEEEQVWLDRKLKYLVVAIQDLLDLNLFKLLIPTLREKIFYVYGVDNNVSFLDLFEDLVDVFPVFDFHDVLEENVVMVLSEIDFLLV